jgi:hypothetical protein
MVEVWDIYYVFTTYTTPPKDKSVAVVSVEPEILGIFINSEINQFVQKRPKLDTEPLSPVQFFFGLSRG